MHRRPTHHGREDGGGEDQNGDHHRARPANGQASFGQGQAAHLGDRVGEFFLIALEQQHVAGSKLCACHALADGLAFSSDGQQGHPEAPAHTQRLGTTALDPGARLDHRFDSADLIGADILFLQALGACEGQPGFLEQVVEGRGVHAQQQEIVRTQPFAPDVGQAAGVVAQQADDDGAILVEGLELAHGLADIFGILVDADFDHIRIEVEHLFGRTSASTLRRDQAPADQEHEDQPDQRDRQADEGEVKQGEGLAGDVGAEGRHDDIRRRADECDQPAEDRCEGQGHQHGGGFLRQAQCQRHEQGQRPHIVHEAREHRADARQGRHLAALAFGHPQDGTRDQIDDP